VTTEAADGEIVRGRLQHSLETREATARRCGRRHGNVR
jgi:hypothetical protein